ncbi:transposase [Coprobacillaceae bacterium CR2/5/TPMF4]|nr:transposase [Coprobacillaceae bacterium CR2/5/TPMF4]
MKYAGYYKEKEKTNEKNRFKKTHMKRTEDGGFICPAGYEFEIEKVTIDSRSNYDKINFLFRNNKCGECPLRNKCTKSKSGRTIVHSYQMEEYQKEVKRNIRSEDGIRLMYQRRTKQREHLVTGKITTSSKDCIVEGKWSKIRDIFSSYRT